MTFNFKAHITDMNDKNVVRSYSIQAVNEDKAVDSMWNILFNDDSVVTIEYFERV